MGAKAPQVPPAERVKTSYKQLSAAAINLNSSSDELSEAIAVWDAALKKLNLGLSAWVTLSGSDNDANGNWWSRDVGYARVGNKWGIALRTQDGNDYSDEAPDVDEWLFNDAPRWMRIEAVGKLPDLLEALLKQAEDTTKKIRAKKAEADELGEAITKIAEEMGTTASEGK
jgi:hypothetical protein